MWCARWGAAIQGLVTVTISCPDKIFLPQGFSPNGDGKNDRLVFTALEYFAPASLKVFNRYGTLVFDNPNYQNDWDGTNMDNNKALPDGTYFYVLTLADKKKYNNYLVINR
jgi:gliding motility-associated-like protein